MGQYTHYTKVNDRGSLSPSPGLKGKGKGAIRDLRRQSEHGGEGNLTKPWPLREHQSTDIKGTRVITP